MSSPLLESVHQTSQFTGKHLRSLSHYSPSSPLRVIALVDYDAFYAQCETLRLGLPPSQPLAVQQWNAVIAVNYPAREQGIKRGAHVDDVIKLCPRVALPHVATWREGCSTWAYRSDVKKFMASDKAALDPYRLVSRKSLRLVKATLPKVPLQKVEKASVDEVFLDLSAQVHSILLQRFPNLTHDSTDNLDSPLPLPPDDLVDLQEGQLDKRNKHHPQGHRDWNSVVLSIGAEIVRNLRQVIWEELGLTCSAGIAHNKTVAKIAAGLNKPNGQTVVHDEEVQDVLLPLRINKIRGLGGKLGDKVLKAFGSDHIKDLLQISLEAMVKSLGEQPGSWLFKVIRGHETSEVVQRTDLQSMLTAKTFTPPVRDENQAMAWLRIFSADLIGRINDLDEESERHRRPTTLALHHHIKGRFGPTRSRQTTIPKVSDFNEHLLLQLAVGLLRQIFADALPTWPCQALSMSVSNFVDVPVRNQRITSFLSAAPSSRSRKRSWTESEETPNSPNVKSVAKVMEVGESSLHFADSSHAHVPKQDTAYTCPLCSEDLEASLVLQHLDWHVAVDLAKQPGP